MLQSPKCLNVTGWCCGCLCLLTSTMAFNPTAVRMSYHHKGPTIFLMEVHLADACDKCSQEQRWLLPSFSLDVDSRFFKGDVEVRKPSRNFTILWGSIKTSHFIPTFEICKLQSLGMTFLGYWQQKRTLLMMSAQESSVLSLKSWKKDGQQQNFTKCI